MLYNNRLYYRESDTKLEYSNNSSLNTDILNGQLSFMEKLFAYCGFSLLVIMGFLAIAGAIFFTTQSYFGLIAKTREQIREINQITQESYKEAILTQYVEHSNEYIKKK
ncbi:MAG: hypothetical protein KBD25_00810 [Rickettsiaceae bacterium]|nr:hypothetical protein [Rickettsiaceae bacterium]